MTSEGDYNTDNEPSEFGDLPGWTDSTDTEMDSPRRAAATAPTPRRPDDVRHQRS